MFQIKYTKRDNDDTEYIMCQSGAPHFITTTTNLGYI